MFSIAIEPTMLLAHKCEMNQAYCFPPITGYLYEIVIHPVRGMIGGGRLCFGSELFSSDTHVDVVPRILTYAWLLLLTEFWRELRVRKLDWYQD